MDTHSSEQTIDNIELIMPMLEFKTSDDFYFLQILQRKKENPQIGSNSRVIKNYYIRSKEHLIEHYDEIKSLCKLFNARASIRLNKRSFEKVGFKSLENIANTMQNREYSYLMNQYDRACGLSTNASEKKWIIDVDSDDMIWLTEIIDSIQQSMPDGDKIIATIPSKSGTHLITRPFNVAEFGDRFHAEMQSRNQMTRKIEIHKDNPTNLYM